MFRKPPTPWATDSIKALVLDRDETRKRANCAGSLGPHWRLYRDLRNAVVSMVHKQKQQYFQYNVNNIKSRPRTKWNEIDKALGTCVVVPYPHLQNPDVIDHFWILFHSIQH